MYNTEQTYIIKQKTSMVTCYNSRWFHELHVHSHNNIHVMRINTQKVTPPARTKDEVKIPKAEAAN